MNKLKLATKRIAAVGSAALLTASTAFGNLGSYPDMFVSNGAFNGQVVVGAAADAMDSTSAASIIDDLRDEFSGSSEKVKITYRASSTGGNEIKFADSGNEWNYGEANQAVRTTAFDESDDDNVFSDDETFDNGYADEDYTQELVFGTNAVFFEHALRDDEQDEISTHLWFEDTTLMTYSFVLDSSMSSVGGSGTSSDFVGEDIEILGQLYTITQVSFDSTKGIDKLTMIGGGSKVALGEGDSTTVTLDGKSYEIEVQAVGSSEVLLTVNGVSKSVDEFDTDVVNGLNVGVTELIESSRDSVKGYAELVLGGREIELEDGQQVKINDVDIDDIHEDYTATATFNGTTGDWDGFQVAYTLEDEVLLEAGESLEDYVFGAFEMMFKGTNDPDYSTVEFSVSSDKVNLKGTHDTGNEFNEDVAFLVNKDAAGATDSPIILIGDSDDDVFLVNNLLNTTATFGTSPGYNASLGLNFTDTTLVFGDGSAVTKPTNGNRVEVGPWYVLNVSNAAMHVFFNLDEASGSRFLVGDNDDQYLWEIGIFTTSDAETDFEDILRGNNEDNVDSANIASKLDEVGSSTAQGDSFGIFTGATSILAFENELLVDFDNAYAQPGYTQGTTGTFAITLDSSDVDADSEPGDISGSAFNIDMNLDTDDDEFNLLLDSSEFTLLSGAESDVSESNDDDQEFTNEYGMIVEYDEEEKRSVKIHVPDEQVRAEVYLVTGGSGAETFETTVDADAVDEMREELEADGYTIVDTETVTTEEVDFDVSGAVLDTEVAGMDDMIVVGGPAVNEVAAELLSLSFPTYGSASGVDQGEAVIRYFASSNSVLVYGYAAADTAAAAEQLNAGGLSGSLVNVQ